MKGMFLQSVLASADFSPAKLRFDLPTSQGKLHAHGPRLQAELTVSIEPRSKLRVSASSAWRAFDNIASFFRAALTTASQLILIMETSRSSGDPLFALSCLVKPLLSAFRQRDIWWIRMASLSTVEAFLTILKLMLFRRIIPITNVCRLCTI